MDGFIGRIELGSITGSQFAAGRSYQGVEASPCIEGSTKGASRDEALGVPFRAISAPLLCGDSLAFGPSAMEARNGSRTASGKQALSCHSWTRSFSFFSCFGAFSNEAALLNKAGK